MNVNAQSEKFDKIVERLFFNVDVSSMSTSLIDSFKSLPSLTYEPPKYGYGSSLYPITWIHIFNFASCELLKKAFDSGQIHLDLEVHRTHESISKLAWICKFKNLDDAKAVFDELKAVFNDTKAAKKIYRFDSTQFAEFLYKKSIKYPHIYLALAEYPARDKTYKIILFWDTTREFEKLE
jgi:hypothetical protein